MINTNNELKVGALPTINEEHELFRYLPIINLAPPIRGIPDTYISLLKRTITAIAVDNNTAIGWYSDKLVVVRTNYPEPLLVDCNERLNPKYIEIIDVISPDDFYIGERDTCDHTWASIQSYSPFIDLSGDIHTMEYIAATHYITVLPKTDGQPYITLKLFDTVHDDGETEPIKFAVKTFDDINNLEYYCWIGMGYSALEMFNTWYTLYDATRDSRLMQKTSIRKEPKQEL